MMAADRIAHYRVKRTIGAGGMATVYEAVDLHNQTTVALKVLHAHLAANATYVARFLAEAQMAKAMNNDHVVRVMEYGEDHGRRYLAMEYVKGKTLQQYLQEHGAMPVVHALAVVDQIAEGLEEANRAGIVHRDIKPQNIMLLARSGAAKLMDFGIARGAAMQALTMTGMFVGTPQYSSPEQALGSAVDIRSDLYSLGVVLYQMLTGTVPFQADTPQALLLRVVQGDPVPVQRLRIDLPAPVVGVIERLLARDPDKRYASPTELREALRPLLSAGKTQAAAAEMASVLGPMMGSTPTTPAPIPELRPMERSRFRLVPTAAGVLVLLLVAVILLTRSLNANTQTAVPQNEAPVPTPSVMAATVAPPVKALGSAATSLLPAPSATHVQSATLPPITPTRIPPRPTATRPRPSRTPSSAVTAPAVPPATTLAAPLLREPAEGAVVTGSVTLRWTAVRGATSYRVETRPSGSTGDTWRVWNAGARAELTIVFTKDLAYFGSKRQAFEWRVIGYDDAGQAGVPSLTRKLVSQIPGPTPTVQQTATQQLQTPTRLPASATPTPPPPQTTVTPTQKPPISVEPSSTPTPPKVDPPTVAVKDTPIPISMPALDFDEQDFSDRAIGAMFVAAFLVILPLGIWQRSRSGPRS